MKTGTRTHGTASLKLSHNPLVPAHLRGGLLEVSHVQTPESDRGQGFASILLQKVCTEADEAGKLLLLNPEPFNDSPLDAQKLMEWYVGYGFKLLQKEPECLLVRQPGAVRNVTMKPLAFAMGMH